MSPGLALIVLGALYLLAGYGVLELAGLQVDGVAGALKLLGLAYVVGLVGTSIVLIALLCVGAALSVSWLIAVSVSLGVGGVVAGRRLHGSVATARARLPKVELIAAVVLLVGLGAFLQSGLSWATVHPLGSSWDAWAMWVHKGYLLYAFGHIPTDFFTSKAYGYMHPNYPMLIPVMNALWFHLARFSAVSLHAQYWALYCGGLWALGYTASRRSRPVVWVPLLCMLAVTPNVINGLMTLYADIPAALFLMLATLWLGEWLANGGAGRPAKSQLMIATILLAGAANTKDEGMTGAIAVLIGAWALLIFSRASRQQIRGLAIASVSFVAMLAPWQLWLAAHHIGGDIPIAKGLDPIYVWDRMNRFGPSISAFYNNATSSGWDGLVVIALIVLVLALYTGTARREVSFYASAALLNVLAIVWVYVISPIDLSWWLATSASRTDDGFVLTVVAATFAVCGQMLPPDSADSRSSIQTSRPLLE